MSTSSLSIARWKTPKRNGASNICGNKVKISIRIIGLSRHTDIMLSDLSLDNFHGMRKSQQNNFKALLDCFRTARQVDDKTLTTQSGYCPAQHGHRSLLQRSCAHSLNDAGHVLIDYGERGFRCNVTPAQTR